MPSMDRESKMRQRSEIESADVTYNNIMISSQYFFTVRLESSAPVSVIYSDSLFLELADGMSASSTRSSHTKLISRTCPSVR